MTPARTRREPERRGSFWTRQREGVAAAKAKGRYKGRPPSIDPAGGARLAETMGPAAIAKHLGVRPQQCLPAARCLLSGDRERSAMGPQFIEVHRARITSSGCWSKSKTGDHVVGNSIYQRGAISAFEVGLCSA